MTIIQDFPMRDGDGDPYTTCENKECRAPVRLRAVSHDLSWGYSRWSGKCSECGREYYYEIRKSEAISLARVDMIMKSIRQMREWDSGIEPMMERVIRRMVLYECDNSFARYMLETLVRDKALLIAMDAVFEDHERESALEHEADIALDLMREREYDVYPRDNDDFF